MKFRGDKARWQGNAFEIHYSSWLDGKTVSPWYLDIKPADGNWFSTELTHRFATKEKAMSFCQDIEEGKISFNSLRAEVLDALNARSSAKAELDQKQASALLSGLADLGMSYVTFLKAFRLFNDTSFDARELCMEMSKTRKDPGMMLQENIVNISMKAGEILSKHPMDQDAYDGHAGLTSLIIESAKRFEQEIGSKTDFDDPDAPDYWETIDAFTEKVLSEEYGLEFNTEKEHKAQPSAEKALTLGTYLEKYRNDIDVCLVDKDTAEHYMPAIVYSEPEEIEEDPEYDYSPREKWLLSLPLDHVLDENGCPLAVVNTEFNANQTDFLLGDTPEDWGHDDEALKLADMLDRACMANAAFSDRLAYLEHGTPFEKPFDGSCMDTVNPLQRNELIKMLSVGDVFFADYSPESDGSDLAAYTVIASDRHHGRSQIGACVAIQMTEPGKGLFSTLEGKLFLANQSKEKNGNPSQSRQPDIERNME